jgi:hypothetical protein
MEQTSSFVFFPKWTLVQGVSALPPVVIAIVIINIATLQGPIPLLVLQM